MNLKMIQTTQGSPDGAHVLTYEKEKEYDIPEKLGNVFLKMGVAEMVTVKENKDSGASPSNKDAGGNKEEKKEKKERK